MPHVTKATDDVYMGMNRQGFYTGMYCSLTCLAASGTDEHFRLTVEDMNDDEDDELWEDGAEGPHVRTPLFGHHCHNPECGALVWD